MIEQESISKLRIDICVAQLLLVVAKAGKPGEPNSDVCFYLGDRYLRLAEKHQQRGASRKSRRLRAKAEKYLGPLQGPPYAAAMAMPVPKRPTFTAAIGWRPRKGPPDDAA
jgi:hypothetical protein